MARSVALPPAPNSCSHATRGDLIPGVIAFPFQVPLFQLGGSSGSAVKVQLAGPDLDQVIGVERIRPLVGRARERLRALGLSNASVYHADGIQGMAARGPYDAILSAAAPREVPAELIDQLCIGGRLVIPVGGSEEQQLCLVIRTADGAETRQVEAVRFVPLLSGLQR